MPTPDTPSPGALPPEMTELVDALALASFALGCLKGASFEEYRAATVAEAEARAALDEVIGRYVEDAERWRTLLDLKPENADVCNETIDAVRAHLAAARSTPRPPSR